MKVTTGSDGSASTEFPPGLGKPAQRALAAAGFTNLAQLILVREADLKKLHGMGPKALGLLRAALAARGEAFADSSAVISSSARNDADHA